MHQYSGQLRDSVPSTKSRPCHCSRVHVSCFLQVTGSTHSQSGLSPGFWLFLQNWKVGPSGFDPLQWFLMFPYFILVSNENLLCHELDLPVTFGQGSAGSNRLLQGRPLKLPIPGSWSHWLSSGEEHQQPECRGLPESTVQPAGSGQHTIAIILPRARWGQRYQPQGLGQQVALCRSSILSALQTLSYSESGFGSRQIWQA